MSFIKCFYETIFGIIEALPIDGGERVYNSMPQLALFQILRYVLRGF